MVIRSKVGEQGWQFPTHFRKMLKAPYIFHNRKLEILHNIFGFHIYLDENLPLLQSTSIKNWHRKCIKSGAHFLFFFMNIISLLTSFLNIPEISCTGQCSVAAAATTCTGSEGWIQPFVTNSPTLNYSFDLL